VCGYEWAVTGAEGWVIKGRLSHGNVKADDSALRCDTVDGMLHGCIPDGCESVSDDPGLQPM